MSIAKKSIKWLVATIVIFALILTVSLAVGSVTRASATTPQDTDHDVDVHVFVADSAELGTYPNLIKSTSARVVTVYYCYDISMDATSTLSEFSAAPVLKYGNTTVRPTQIDLNNNFTSKVEISNHTNADEGYLASTGAAKAFNISLKAGAKAADLNSYISGAFDQTKYLFSADYAIAANAVGAYELDFGTPTMFSLSSSNDVYYPAIENGDFNIRAIIPIPTAVEGLVYTGAEQTGVTVDYTLGYELEEGGSIAETNKGNYSATFALLDIDTTCWEGNTITDKTVPWSIAKMQIAIPEVGSGTYTYTGEEQTYAFAAAINSTYIEITDGTKINAGTYTVTASLKDAANTRWAGGGDDVADKVYTDAFVINPFTVAIPEAKSGKTYIYDGTTQTFLYEDELLTDYYTYEPVTGKDADTYVVTFELKDKANTVWTGNTTANQSVQFTIAPKAVTLAFSSDNYNATYNEEITAHVPTTEDVVEGDNLQIGVSGTPEQGDPVGVYNLTATWDTTNTNYTVTGAAATYTINTRYIPIPVKDTTVTYTYTGEELTFAFTEDVDEEYVVLANNVKTLPGTYNVTANLNTAVHGNNIAWADNGEGEYEYEFVIDPAMVSVSFVGVFNDVEKTLAEDVELAVLANLPTYDVRWFKPVGYTFNNAAATTVTFEMNEGVVYIAYSYAVGAGDADGDGVITAGDVIQMKRYFVGLDEAQLIADADAAWANSSNSAYNAVAVLNTALDVNGTLTFRTNDIVAVREALATGYDYKVVIEEGIQLVKKVNRITVTTYEALDDAGWSLLKALKAGYPVTLGAPIAAANKDFVLDSDIPVDINLGSYRLTVKGFTLNTNTTGATLKITNGTLYTVNGITVTAPSGNVIVADVNGYSYDGTSVNLAAYSESLHIENNVAFYIYHQKVDNQPVALAEFVETVTSADALTALADTRIHDTTERMQEIAAIKADTTLDDEAKATAINAKEVKKAIIEVPVDTHVVVEENANLSVDKLVVKAQSDENASAVNTFAIEVKNAAAAEVAVDITEVKDNKYIVSQVDIAGVSSKVEVIKGENTATVKKYVAQIGSANYETLQAAINAAANGDVIKLLDNVPNGTGIEVPDGQVKNITIDFNGKTYTMVTGSVGSTGTETQAMHWSNNSTVTLKNGTFVVSAQAATVAGSNGKIVMMAMQNYSALTVKNMTMDFSNISVQNYGDYTGTIYEAYTGLEISLFNTNAGSINIEGSTITMPANSTKGICINIAGAIITNSTINGAVSLNSDDADPSVTVTNSTITKGVVSYFAGDYVIHEGNIYRIAGEADYVAKIGAKGYLSFDAALADAQDNDVIEVQKNVSSVDGYLINKDLEIDLNGNTITVETGASTNNRVFKIAQDKSLTIYDGTIDALGGGTTSSNGYGCFGSFRAEVGSTLVAHDLVLKNYRPYGLNVKVLGASATLTNVEIISAYGGGIEVTDDDGAAGTVQGYAAMYNCTVTQSGYFDHCSSAVSVSGASTLDVYSTSYTAEYGVYVFSSGGTINVHGGSFTALSKNVLQTSYDANYGNAAIINVYDGEFYGTFGIVANGTTLNVYGGSFDHDPTNYLANGCMVTVEGGMYLVKACYRDPAEIFAEARTKTVSVINDHYNKHTKSEGTANGEFQLSDLDMGEGYDDLDLTIDDFFVLVGNVGEDVDTVTIGGFVCDKNATYVSIGQSCYINFPTLYVDDENNVYVPAFVLVAAINDESTIAFGDGEEMSFSADINIGALTLGTAAPQNNKASVAQDGNNILFVKHTSGKWDSYLEMPFAEMEPTDYYVTVKQDVGRPIGFGISPADALSGGVYGVWYYPLVGRTTAYKVIAFNSEFAYKAISDTIMITGVSATKMITTFAELSTAIGQVNAGTLVNPTLYIANDIAFEAELTISKSVTIQGNGSVKFIGYDASTKYDEAFYINVADEDQEITIDGIIFDHFSYYSNVANKTKATSAAVKNAVAYITYGGNCPASTSLTITGCQFLGTARQMINVASTIGCKGYIVIEDSLFDATDRLMSTLNILEFYGNEDAELSVLISGCTFKEATEQNATWATSAIASFGNADITVTGCEFIACQVAIGIDNTFDRLFDAVTYPVYYNTTVTLVENTYTNCYYGYYEESVVASTDDIPEGFELDTDSPYTIGNYAATQFTAYEYDYVEPGTQGVDAKYLTVISYYVKA